MPATSQKAFSQTVKGMFDKWVATCHAGDVEGWLALWDEGGIQLPPGAPMNVGKAAIRKAEVPLFAAFKFETFVINVTTTYVDRDLGFACGTTTYTLAPTAGGDKMKGDAKFETLFKRQPDGSWKVFTDTFNSNVP